MIKLLYSNKFDSATVSSLNAATGYSAANVKNPFLKQTYRSTGLSNQWIKFDLASAKLVTMFTFFNNNFTTGATIKLYGHASDLGATEALWASGATYSATISNFDTRAAFLSLSQTFRYWLLAVTDASNPAGYIELGRVYAGEYVSPSLNFNESFNETFLDPSDQNWTVGASLYSTQRERYKTFSIQFLDLATADQTVLRNFYASVFKTEPFVLALDPDNEPINLTRYGMMTNDLDFQWTTNNRVNTNLEFRELR